MKSPVVYILASKPRGVLYIGVTSDLIRRVAEHRAGRTHGFTSRYGIKVLVWYEQHGSMLSAIAREKSLKKWRRDWKVGLIERTNGEWRDLWAEVCEVRSGL